MFRLTGKSLILAAVVAAAVSFGTTQAEAGWHHWRHYYPSCYSSCYVPTCHAYAYTGCYTPCTWTYYSPCYDTSCDWYLGVRPGPVRRLLFGRYKWYPAWGCCDVCGCDPCGCATVCYDGVAACDAAVEVHSEEGPVDAKAERPTVEPSPTLAPPDEPEPKAQPKPQPKPEAEKPKAESSQPESSQPAAPAQPEPSADERPALPMPKRPSLPTTVPDESRRVPTRSDSGLLTLWVPIDATVSINGQETTSKGTRREYVSYGLKPGFTYKYVVRAEIVRDGQPQVETKTIYLTAGASEGLAFGFTEQPTEGLALAR